MADLTEEQKKIVDLQIQEEQLYHTIDRDLEPTELLGDDLGLDSLDVIELSLLIEKEFSDQIKKEIELVTSDSVEDVYRKVSESLKGE